MATSANQGTDRGELGQSEASIVTEDSLSFIIQESFKRRMLLLVG